MRNLLIIICLSIGMFCFAQEDFLEELIVSTPNQLNALSSKSSYLVGGLISPMGGHLTLRQTDLIAKGAQNIDLTRVYIPPYMPTTFSQHTKNQAEYTKKYLYYHLIKNYKGWQFFPHLMLQFYPKNMKIRLSEPTGATYDFQILGSKTILTSPWYAINNTSDDEPHGKYDPRNTRISYENQGGIIIVHSPEGTVRQYDRKAAIRDSFSYLLNKETLTNGKILKYRYNEKSQLISIESMDPMERYVYASLFIEGVPKEGKCRFTTASGLSVDYNFERKRLDIDIKEKINGGSHKEKFNVFCPPILTSVSSPFYRDERIFYNESFLLNSYSAKENVFTTSHGSFGNTPHQRIDSLSFPVGENDIFKSVYKFHYEPAIAGENEGFTHIKNSDGTSAVYHFSKNLLLKSIQNFDQMENLKKEKIFSWNQKNQLESVETKGLSKKSYTFDNYGNPVTEVFWGDLIGDGTQTNYVISREYSQDGRNLLLKEKHENGKTICYSYLPNTNLVTAKLTKDCHQIMRRDFSQYDDCNNLIQIISDDGKGSNLFDLDGITQRTITNYILRQQSPFLHMPEWIEEKYVECGNEKLLKRKHLSYDNYGNISQEEIYSSDNLLAYTLYKEYNERGDLVSETNAFGNQATYNYDAKGRLVAESNFSQRLHKTITYDGKGRPRNREENGDDGSIHTALFNYDFHDRLIDKTDTFSNTTKYTYDPVVEKINKSDLPPIESADRQAIPVATSSTFDSFGRKLTETDANGNTITYCYNAYGSPTEISHPDGGKERFVYEKDGSLRSYTDLDDLTVLYSRDILGRVTSKKYVSANQEILAEEMFTYSGFNLLMETDKEGNPTEYTYDGAGRKVRENISGRITEFSYDSLGWLSGVFQPPLFVHYKKDFEGRLLEKTKADASNNIHYKISYTYDPDGNKTAILKEINGEKAVDNFSYDSFGRLTQITDAKGFITSQGYNENHFNALGQKVLQTTITDPRNITTIETNNAHHRLVKVEIPNSSSKEIVYDPYGNLSVQKDHVYENGLFKKTQTTQYTYNPTHHVESLTKAVGTEHANTTTYTYLHSGKLKTKCLPAGVTLFYEYHPLGLLSGLFSSDQTIQHSFQYNRLGDLLEATDRKENISIKRTIDPFRNVTQEIFPSGLCVDKEYDGFNRPLSIKISGNGKITYRYDQLFLKEVTRFSDDEKKLYTHLYEYYDLNGNLVSEKMIGNLGKITHKIDVKGQQTSITSPFFSQECIYDSAGNLISNITDSIESRYAYDELSQICSEKDFEYRYDSLYNRIKKNENTLEINDLNQLTTSTYDLNGNQTSLDSFQLVYDPLNRLIEASSAERKIIFKYDPLGRRLSRAYTLPNTPEDKEYYLYDGQHEIGAFTSANIPKNFRVLGIEKHKTPAMVALEINGKFFAPILDMQNNVHKLVDIQSNDIVCDYKFSAFGEKTANNHESVFNPWQFASKRFDPNLLLIDFGKRYYAPQSGRWLTIDPAGFIDSMNLYQYVFNNPFRYTDPDGQFAFIIPLLFWGAELALPSLTAIVAPIIYGAITSAVVYGGYKVGEWINTPTVYKNTETYAPDRPLPLTPHGVPIPDTGAPHTQLGTKQGRRSKYPQAREFDDTGNPVRDIDFTDHGRPQNHPNPHQHEHQPNPTGGTRIRDPKGEPVSGWSY